MTVQLVKRTSQRKKWCMLNTLVLDRNGCLPLFKILLDLSPSW